MKLELNKTYHGFKLLEEKNIKEINSTARLFEHEKTGGRLFHLGNEDDNKVFSISFRTPPEDSTGLPHILEHSVLCGSRKFPSKEPFVELIKGSLNTFLNAMTFSDKTMYPVASRNPKDFRNLMDVYLDAVLYPNIYKYPEILMQEGWHYELDSKDSVLTYKGVVYNEMKGAFSSPESILMRKVKESLFPDTPYGFESGGDPDVIPELTQEQFIAFHKKYYHPSNSFIFLYGNMNLLDDLKFINDEYLNNFDKIQVDSEIPYQMPFNEERKVAFNYPISPNEKEEDKTFLSLNFAVGKATDKELSLAFDILEHLLLETPAAPLKKALIDADLGKDVFGSFDNGILQPTFSVVVKNTNEDKIHEFKKVVLDTLKNLVSNGIDKKLVESSINIKEFQLRESEYDGYPKGLMYGIRCMDSWLYGENPALHLEYEDALNKIKTALTSSYFENLIEKYLLNNTHRSLVIAKPQKGLSEEKAAELAKKLADYKAGLPEDEINKIIENTKKLKERQETPDSPEALEKIPLLSLSDIEVKAEKLPLEEKTLLGLKVLAHPIFTSGIGYVSLYFNSRTVSQDKLPYINLLSAVLGKIGTEKYSYEELSNEININTGGIRFSGDAFAECGSNEVYYPKFVIRSKALITKLPKLMELLGEILGHSKFNDRKRLKEIIQEMKSRMEMRMLQRGHTVASKRACSYFSPIAKYEETLIGLSFYKFISDLDNNFEAKLNDIVESLESVSKAIFNKNNIILSFTGDEKDYSNFEQNFPILYENLGNESPAPVEYKFEFSPLNEGLMTSSKVQYVAKAYNFRKLGYSYTGTLQVLKTIVGFDYLWNRVRVQGGAYGAFANFQWGGNTVFSSYRDPNLTETLNAYDKAAEFIENFNADNREMTKYIIGTISELDSPLTPAMKGYIADEYYIRHVTQEAIQKEREEILNTKKEDIKNLASLVSDVMKQNYFCVLGSEEKIKANKDIFGNIINVFD
ncbi:insulinase family protein [Clostridium sp. SYSU_GA19001]|uniref:insulinase family protein n=1 Tax=Clostridium caldaquaticum TaxID=2940653 RepID=UPI002077560D|nr:insulinase family protein [Clostridium caldaquaticum]MCM8709462.1 insulinase family protein [Clostridium caldaquaticum]